MTGQKPALYTHHKTSTPPRHMITPSDIQAANAATATEHADNTMKTIKEFCETHRACADDRSWAIANCQDMQEVWRTAKPEWLIWVATRPEVLTNKELRLFAVWCARQVQHLLADPRSINSIDVAERHANGQATDEELAAAREAARAAAWAAAWEAARDAAREAARAAARDAARAAARDAAREAARDAAWAAALEAAWDAAWEAARDAALDAQAKWLRENTTPNFD